MSGVYIKGMDVPPNCWWCPVKFWNDSEYICPFSHKHINSGDADRHDDCPLLPVRDHGDLIDRDAMRKDWKFSDSCNRCERDAYRCQYYEEMSTMDVCGMLDDAPVVIPAERSEE